MPRAVLQSTLNDQINVESVLAYAERLKQTAALELDRGWLDGPTPSQQATADALTLAAQALDIAAELAHKAQRMSSELAYARIYKKPEPTFDTQGGEE